MFWIDRFRKRLNRADIGAIKGSTMRKLFLRHTPHDSHKPGVRGKKMLQEQWPRLNRLPRRTAGGCLPLGSRKYIRLPLPTMAMVITPSPLLKKEAG